TQRAGRRVLLVAADDKSGVEEAVSHLDRLEEISLTDFIAYSAYAPEKTEKTTPTPAPEEEEQGEEANYTAGQVFTGTVILVQPR
ncbi:MAG: hypothetical protein ACE5G7_02950, partial [Candidatus Hydrothermarchaeaceae archaeon]